MKKKIAQILLISGYCIPYVFLAMNEDAVSGTLWFYLVMIVGFSTLCYAGIKLRNAWLVVLGNILSFASSCIFTYFFSTEKWGWYFKPFTPYQLIVFESVFVFLIQLIVVTRALRKSKVKAGE